MSDEKCIPVACTLAAEERPARREMIARIGRAVQEIQEREDGYAYRFDSDAILPDLAAMIQAERRCCAFLQFRMTFAPGNGPLWLEITGPEGTREFLGSWSLTFSPWLDTLLRKEMQMSAEKVQVDFTENEDKRQR
jgi:hypothetical protein